MVTVPTSARAASAVAALNELEIVFWQRIVSIHQAPMIVALAAMPGVKVTYVAEETTSDARRSLGWVVPSLGEATLVSASSVQSVAALLPQFSAQAFHFCEGIRSNGIIGTAEKYLRQQNRRTLVLAETVDDQGCAGIVKRLWYNLALWRASQWVDSVLAIGDKATSWFIARGFPRERVFPFSYFLDPAVVDASVAEVLDVREFQLAFVGNFIPRKNLDLLIEALAMLPRTVTFKLIVVGAGPLENELQRLAFDCLGDRVVWRGLIDATAIPEFLSNVDCLVLPSEHDGWGAVVSEALIVGTPVICSDRVGAAVAVRSSRAGGVFRSGDRDALTSCVLGVMSRGLGRTAERAHLASWARRNLSGKAGANYLIAILQHRFAGAKFPLYPILNPRF